MIVKIPKQRQVKKYKQNPFSDLVSYTVDALEKQKQMDGPFKELINYETATQNHAHEAKCIGVRTHGISDLENAAGEMSAISLNNPACKDPAYHFILSWPEFEKPSKEAIFEAAEHAIRSLGMGEHQYVIAIHDDTDNIHCHVAVNRVHPVTFKSHHIQWSKKTLHMAARQSEIKHGWHHDNGYYVVNIDKNGKKTIGLSQKYIDRDVEAGQDPMAIEDSHELPTWHDPESLESWLKGFVTKSLKRDIKQIQSWYGLHAWLDQYGIKLVNTGGGGMRLTVISPDTGEIQQVAASRGLRILKLTELEERWGSFRRPDDFTEYYPDFTNINQRNIQKGVQNVLRNGPDRGNPPPDHINNAINVDRERQEETASRNRDVHDMPDGDLENRRSITEMLVQNDVSRLMGGGGEGGADQDVRRTEPGREGNRKRKSRSIEYRDARREYRAAIRADLRMRFQRYRKFTHDIDISYWPKLRELRKEKKEAFLQLKEDIRAIKATVDWSRPDSIFEAARIKHEFDHKKLLINSEHQTKLSKLNHMRVPPLGWRVWLHEQAQLGDQAAVSALRGIVYQAKRDAKRMQDISNEIDTEELEIINSSEDEAVKEQRKFKLLLKRLYEEEQTEIAVRAAKYYLMRPYEIDSILVRYQKISWYVTGNGNIEYSHEDGRLAFIDKGNRITFDREVVTDAELEMALVHASQKFGNQVLLTGTDEIFMNRMVAAAMRMNLRIINPDLQPYIESIKQQHKNNFISSELIQTVPVIEEGSLKEIVKNGLINRAASNNLDDPVKHLENKVRNIIPNAQFLLADQEKTYSGKIISISDDFKLFAQHIGNNQFIIHKSNVEINHKENTQVVINYQNGNMIVAQSSEVER